MSDLVRTLKQIKKWEDSPAIRLIEEGRDPAYPAGAAAPVCTCCSRPTTTNGRFWCAACDKDGLCLDCRESHSCGGKS